MSLLDDAREMAASNGMVCREYHDDHAYVCPLGCAMPNRRDDVHAKDCPWLSMPKIVAVLEAAEVLHQKYGHVWIEELSEDVEKLIGAMLGHKPFERDEDDA